jgi:Homeodomain-like domain
MARPHTKKIELTLEEKQQLERGCKYGDWTARKITRARVLLLANVGATATQIKPLKDEDIAKEAKCSKSMVGYVRKRFQSERLKSLDEHNRSGRPKIVDGLVEAQMIAIACSKAPEGRERWTLRLLADRLVELVDDLDDISYTTIGKALKKTNLNHG